MSRDFNFVKSTLTYVIVSENIPVSAKVIANSTRYKCHVNYL